MRTFPILLLLAGAACATADVPSSSSCPAGFDPHDNAWPSAGGVDRAVAAGWTEGRRLARLCLPDQHGDLVSTRQFAGAPLVVEITYGWYWALHEVDRPALLADHADDGLRWITVLRDDVDGGPSTGEFRAMWADEKGLGHLAPVVADPGDLTEAATPDDGPVFLQVRADGVIAARGAGADELTARGVVERGLQE